MSDPEFNAPSVNRMAKLMPNFDFEAQISATDYNAVYLATQKSLDRHVAVKVYSPELSHNSAFKIAFERAAKSMAKLSHLNLISMYNSGEIEGMAYMVTEFVDGKSLIHHCKKNKLSVKESVEIVSGLASGVAYAHDYDVLHGGLSIDNILLNSKNEPKIGSFGFMIDTGDDEFERFSAPELSEPSSIITPQVDIYSLGVILYELLTGEKYGPAAKSLNQFTGVGTKLDEIFKKATAKNPAERYKSVKEFRDVLQKASTMRAGVASKLAPAKKNAGAKRPAANRPLGAGPSSPPPPSVGGGGMKLVRNIAIIIVLLIAIKIAWDQKNARETELEGGNDKEQVIQAKLRAAKEDERKREQERLARLAAERIQQNNQSVPEVTVPTPPVVVEEPKDIYGSLDRLRDRLVEGSRLEMPDGTERIGAFEFLLIDKPMTWADASQFATSYGAHLAVPSLDATSAWLAETMLKEVESSAWLGVAKNSNASWSTMRGLPWKADSSLAGGGGYLALTPSGSMAALEADEKRPFIIQWHRDGKNPGSLENLLGVTKQTLGELEPVYPPGTQAFGARHYLFVPQSVTWDEAAKIAESGGGHLAVISGVAERFNLKKLMASLPAEEGVWFGGVFDGGNWVWKTGEAWSRTNWIDGSEPKKDGAALVVLQSSDWTAKDRNDVVSGFLIEWSKDNE